MTLAGQWLNRPSEGGAPTVVLDLDDSLEGLTGSGRVFFPDGSPGTICEISIPRSFLKTELEVRLYWIPPGTISTVDTNKIRELFPEYAFADTAKINLEKEGDALRIRWLTSVGTKGDERLIRSDMDAPSLLISQKMGWEEFKKHALSKRAGDLIFRGQPKTYRVRTAFHRTYRKDLVKYVAQDIPAVYRQLSARTQHLFDLENP